MTDPDLHNRSGSHPSRPPIATYRWQLTTDAGFDAAAAAAPDLAALGISHLYLSPVAEATPGSTHGYDVVDPTRLRAELGGAEAFERLVATAHRFGLGIVIDIVPNHMAADAANPWWWDVLRLGRRSRWAATFDVDWDPPKGQLRETVLVPVLGDHFGRELEAGELRIARGRGEGRLLVVRYHEHEFPVSPATTAHLLERVAVRADDDVLGVAARVMARVEDQTADIGARDTDLRVAERTALARLDDPAVAAAVDVELDELAADHDRLEALLEQQHHRLARWRIGASELDYRRFFDVDTLVATRTDDDATWELLHRLPIQLVNAGAVDGLRVDHVDGLRDPAAHLGRLRKEVGDDPWLLVEKILRADEDLPEDWPVDGTTGYEVAELLGGWLTDPGGAAMLSVAWRDLTGSGGGFEAMAIECRRLVIDAGLAADVERVTDALVEVCEGRRRHRDHARSDLRLALVEVAVHAPGYRSYVHPSGEPG
ncbi:MAG: malto-oligosyltrehalose synthase, partial [Acidimicrobiia bacterium]|nr:malto-oligosyltrehalose synthase [Acidimicrobiia bacterium]